jgi:hypothetical protein
MGFRDFTRSSLLFVSLVAIQACSGSPDGRIFVSSNLPTDDAGSSAASSSSSSSTSSSSVVATASASTSAAAPVTSVTCAGMTVDCTTGNYADSVGLTGTGASVTYVVGGVRYWCEPGSQPLPACPTGAECTLYERDDAGVQATVGSFRCNE